MLCCVVVLFECTFEKFYTSLLFVLSTFHYNCVLLCQYDEVKEKTLERDLKRAQLNALEENWLVLLILQILFCCRSLKFLV